MSSYSQLVKIFFGGEIIRDGILLFVLVSKINILNNKIIKFLIFDIKC